MKDKNILSSLKSCRTLLPPGLISSRLYLVSRYFFRYSSLEVACVERMSDKMKTLHVLLSVMMAIFLSVSLLPAADVHAAAQEDVQIIIDTAQSRSKPVLIKIVNKTNRYISLTLDHRTEHHLYNLSVAPGVNQYWVYSGTYNYHYSACNKSVHGHTTLKKGSKLTLVCIRA